jgi:hypothetical protein
VGHRRAKLTPFGRLLLMTGRAFFGIGGRESSCLADVRGLPDTARRDLPLGVMTSPSPCWRRRGSCRPAPVD